MSLEMTPYYKYALVWLGIGAVRVEEDPGILPPYTLNFRVPPDGAIPDDVIRGMGGYLYGLAREMELAYDGICGVPPGGQPFASAFSRKTSCPLIWLEYEEAGRRPRIALGFFKILLAEMELSNRSHILLITDVLTSGEAERETAGLLRGQGLVVTDILAIVDREEGGEGALARDDLRLHALCKVTELMRSYLDDSYISEEQYQCVVAYVRSR